MKEKQGGFVRKDEIWGFWQTPQTRIVMEEPEEDVTAIYCRFFLQFLSAGG